MNFKDLESIAGQHASQRGATKQSDFEATLEKGMQLLSHANSEGFQNTDTLMKACDTLIEAIAIARNDVRPYLALAYLFSIIEDFKTAEEYLYAAIKIEPQNPDLTSFLENIQVFQKEVTPQGVSANQAIEIKVPDSPPPYREAAVAPNYQALYSELERFILEKLKDLFSRPVQIESTVNPAKYKILMKSYQNLNQVIQYMEQQAQIIEQKLNVASLQEKMMPFKVLKGRYVKAIKTSKQLMEIQDTIELWSFKTDKQVQVVNQKLTMSALTYGRVDVYRMMDGCDLIADQLDQLSEDEHIEISLVESAYEKLLGLVESLNNRVEDSGAVLENKNKLSEILD